MEQTREPIAAAAPARMKLQSIEDFEAEMDAMDVEQAATSTSTPAKPLNPYHLPKKPKRVVDVETLQAEKLAREEMGNEDWISKLNGVYLLFRTSFVEVLDVRLLMICRLSSYTSCRSTGS